MSVTLTTSSPPLPGAEANLGYLFRLAYQRFRALLEEALEDIGLSAQEYAILSVFETRAELSTSELARITQVTRQTMHQLILRLESAGLIEASSQRHDPDEDERRIYYRLTPFGRRVLTAELLRLRELVQLAETQRIIRPART